ncbi:MAG: methionine sulfoxide reductase heme-binding subunit [Gaiellales bacterium]|nr:methionine sulfoxide reductase heme-binding subunit [Gaiellales bacterium]
MKSDPTFWILARAGGMAAYLLLTTSVIAGLVVKSKPFGRAVKPASTVDFHKALAFLSLLALAIHGAALVADESVHISLGALLIPGLAPYRPFWTGLGVLAGELMLLIYVSFALRKRIGQKNWRRLHYATYATFAGATLHGLMAGSDSSAPWAMAIYLSAVGTVTAATAWRILIPSAPPRPHPTPRPTSTEGAPS